jgi:hypothetical protein
MKTKMKLYSALLGLLTLCVATNAQTTDPRQTSAGGCLIIEPTHGKLLSKLKGLDKPTVHLLIETNSDWEVTSLYSASGRLGRVVLHNIKTDKWMTLSPGSTSNGISVVSIADDMYSAVFLIGTNEINWAFGSPDPEINDDSNKPLQAIGDKSPQPDP